MHDYNIIGLDLFMFMVYCRFN